MVRGRMLAGALLAVGQAGAAAALLATAVTVAAGGGAAWAAPVRGSVALPSDLRSGRRHRYYWRVENGNVQVQPPPFRGETAVVLQGFGGATPAAKTVTVEIAGLQANPPLVVIGVGSYVELKNSGRVSHDLSTVNDPSVMPIQRLGPNNVRRQKFVNPGAYLIQCAQYPHVVVSVLVVDSPHFAITDDKGSFRIDAPDGKGTLKVWSHGRWVHEEPIEIAGKAVDMQVKVSSGSGPRETSE